MTIREFIEHHNPEGVIGIMTGSKGDVLVNLFTVQEGEARTIRLPQRPAVRLAGLDGRQFRLGRIRHPRPRRGRMAPDDLGRGTPLQREQGMRLPAGLALSASERRNPFIQNRRNDVCWQRDKWLKLDIPGRGS